MDKANVIRSPHINGLIQSAFRLQKPNVSIFTINELSKTKAPFTKKKTKDFKMFRNMYAKRQNPSTTES